MRKSSAALLILLAVVAWWRWSADVATSRVLPDEQVYLRAARNLAEGRSPYAESIYFYPPTVAVFVQHATVYVGELGALRILRYASLIGLVALVVLALEAMRWPWMARLLTGAIFLSLAPAVKLSIDLGNVAGLASGLVMLGLVTWKRAPIPAGISLGLGLAIKPIAPLVPLLLAVHRPLQTGKQRWIAAISCVCAATAACIGGLRHLPDLLANASSPTSPYNFALRRVLLDLGIQTPPLVILTLVGGGAVLILRRRRSSEIEFLSIAVASSLVALPILWAHSLLLLLPIQLLAVDRCIRALAAWSRVSRRTRFAVVFAVLALAATLLAQAAGAVQDLQAWLAAVARATPLVSIPTLAWFVVAGPDLPLREDGPERTSC